MHYQLEVLLAVQNVIFMQLKAHIKWHFATDLHYLSVHYIEKHSSQQSSENCHISPTYAVFTTVFSF